MEPFASLEILQQQEHVYERFCHPHSLVTPPPRKDCSSLISKLVREINLSTDLTKIAIPPYLLKPISFLECAALNSIPLNCLLEASQQEDEETRILKVTEWVLLLLGRTPQQTFSRSKPCNPILFEQFHCQFEHNSSTTTFSAEQVSHHPIITAYHMENKKHGFKYSVTTEVKSTFLGNKVETKLDGSYVLSFSHTDDIYEITLPTILARGILIGSSSIELGRELVIQSSRSKLKTVVSFKKNELTGSITKDAQVLYKMSGLVNGDVFLEHVNSRLTKKWFFFPQTFIEQCPQIFIKPVSQQHEKESRRVWHQVCHALLHDDMVTAQKAKNALEDHQRKLTKQGVFHNQEPSLFRRAGRKSVKNLELYEFIQSEGFEEDELSSSQESLSLD